MKTWFATFFLAMIPMTTMGQPLAFLNHFYVMLDPADYQAINDSDFLKNTFAAFESRNTIRDDRSYSGLYFYGDNTYIEFHSTADPLVRPTDPPKAASAIVFGVDQSGSAANIGAETCANALTSSIVTRDYPTAQGVTQQIPWFLMWRAPVPASPVLDTFMMEYQPDFLKLWHPELNTPVGVKRNDILNRYKAQIAASTGLDQSHRLFTDVREIHVELSTNELAILLKEATDFGCALEQRADGSVILRTAGGETIYASVGSTNRITAVIMQLAKPVSAQSVQFGASTTLKFNGDQSATWLFGKKP